MRIIFAMAIGLAGVVILAVSHYQQTRYVVGMLISARAKHFIGLLLIFLALLIFLSKFTTR